MSGLLIPVSMVVVGHDGDPVEIPGETRHVVANINDLLARGDSGGQQRTPFPYRHLEPLEMMKMKYSVGSGHFVHARGGIASALHLMEFSQLSDLS